MWFFSVCVSICLCLCVWINRVAHLKREKHCILCWYGTFNILDTIRYDILFHNTWNIRGIICLNFDFPFTFLLSFECAVNIIIHLFCCSKYRWSILIIFPWQIKYESWSSAHRNLLYECNCHCCGPPKSFQRGGKKKQRETLDRLKQTFTIYNLSNTKSIVS